MMIDSSIGVAGVFGVSGVAFIFIALTNGKFLGIKPGPKLDDHRRIGLGVGGVLFVLFAIVLA